MNSSVCFDSNLSRILFPGTLWVNLYGSSKVATEIDGAGRVRLTQDSRYPWDGRVRMTVNEIEGGELTLKLRIPEWSSGAGIRINESPETLSLRPGSYASITRL